MLSARAGYDLWASSYDHENAISFLENQLAGAMAPARGRLLDAGCGTARRLQGAPARAVGVDLSVLMLQAGSQRGRVAAADLLALPFPNASFDTVWCRLAVGHVANLRGVYSELSRVCDDGGSVFVSDFHPAAAALGHRRTFRDEAGTCHELEHFIHLPDVHAEVAGGLGLGLVAQREGSVGPIVQPYYERRGMQAQYREQLGLPLVLALRFERRARA